jgi:hypothetical protein
VICRSRGIGEEKRTAAQARSIAKMLAGGATSLYVICCSSDAESPAHPARVIGPSTVRLQHDGVAHIAWQNQCCEASDAGRRSTTERRAKLGQEFCRTVRVQAASGNEQDVTRKVGFNGRNCSRRPKSTLDAASVEVTSLSGSRLEIRRRHGACSIHPSRLNLSSLSPRLPSSVCAYAHEARRLSFLELSSRSGRVACRFLLRSSCLL